MDVAGKSGDFVAADQGMLLGEHLQWLESLEKFVVRLTTAFLPSLLSQATTAKTLCASVACRDICDGNPIHYKGFLLLSSLYFTSQENMSNDKNVPEFITLFTGKVLWWATEVWDVQDKALSSFDHFLGLLHGIFRHCLEEGEASGQLLSISQGKHQAANFILEFHKLVAGEMSQPWKLHSIEDLVKKNLQRWPAMMRKFYCLTSPSTLTTSSENLFISKSVQCIIRTHLCSSLSP